MELISAGDTAASVTTRELEREVALLYHEQAGGLLRYAASLTRSADAARDAVQEAFLRYFVERRYGRQIESQRAWLYRVVRNYVLEGLGATAGSREVDAEALERLAGVEDDPEARLRRSEAAREIASVLSSRELECLRLRVEGLSYEEIAAALGIRTGTVGALLARVYAKLRSVAACNNSIRFGTAGLELLLSGGGAYSS